MLPSGIQFNDSWYLIIQKQDEDWGGLWVDKDEANEICDKSVLKAVVALKVRSCTHTHTTHDCYRCDSWVCVNTMYELTYPSPSSPFPLGELQYGFRCYSGMC